jgi:hypothetical protein
MPKYGVTNYTIPALLAVLFIQLAAVLGSIGIVYAAVHFIHKFW